MIAKEKLNILWSLEQTADLEGTCEESSGNRRRIK